MKGINLHEPYRGIEATELRVELDKKALFALASDTRMDILKSLQPNRRTVSQLAEAIRVDKSAVHRHLKKLEEGGFVKREEDHGFIYYGLSWKARDILSPNENTKIVVLITASIVLIGAMILMVYMANAVGPVHNGDSQTPMQQASQSGVGPEVSRSAEASPIDLLATLVPVFIAVPISLILIYLAYGKNARPRQADPPQEPEMYGEAVIREDD
jgi:DNA-binding transcriptional ArsR family regulator